MRTPLRHEGYQRRMFNRATRRSDAKIVKYLARRFEEIDAQSDHLAELIADFAQSLDVGDTLQ